MHTQNSLFIDADIDDIFALAANIQDWPTLLPHYREVTVFEQSADGNRKVVEMSAVRRGFPAPGLNFPVRWRSVQICEPTQHRIFFKHTAGLAVNMWVVWTFVSDPWGRGVEVAISHDLKYPFTVLNGWFAQDLVGAGFVQAIAGETLKTIKLMAENDAAG